MWNLNNTIHFSIKPPHRRQNFHSRKNLCHRIVTYGLPHGEASEAKTMKTTHTHLSAQFFLQGNYSDRASNFPLAYRSRAVSFPFAIVFVRISVGTHRRVSFPRILRQQQQQILSPQFDPMTLRNAHRHTRKAALEGEFHPSVPNGTIHSRVLSPFRSFATLELEISGIIHLACTPVAVAPVLQV